MKNPFPLELHGGAALLNISILRPHRSWIEDNEIAQSCAENHVDICVHFLYFSSTLCLTFYYLYFPTIYFPTLSLNLSERRENWESRMTAESFEFEWFFTHVEWIFRSESSTEYFHLKLKNWFIATLQRRIHLKRLDIHLYEVIIHS